MTRWTGRLVDPAQEERFRAGRHAVLRRDALVAAGAVVLYNVWALAEAFLVSPSTGSALAAAANNAVLLLGAAVVVVGQLRARSWRGAARGVVVAVVAYDAVSVAGTLVADTTPQAALIVTLASVAVVYLHAQLPLPWTAALGVGFTAASAAAVLWAVEHRSTDFPAAGQVRWDFAVEAAVLLLIVNVIGLVAVHRGATNERLLFAEREAVRHLSQTDPLTGLSNRRRWEEQVAEAWRAGAASGRPAGLVLVDVDAFKAVNDAYGHAGGDELLRVVAGLVAQHARGPGDLAARLGGDEFALLLADADLARARAVAASLLQAARDLRAASGDGPTSRLGLSIGAAAGHPGSTASWAQVEVEADALLYAAKAAGRDQVGGGAPAPGPAPTPAPAPVTR